MKTMYETITKKILLFTGVFIISILTGCSLSDEEYSDIRVIEQIIKKDAEQVFGVELANDSIALPEDSLETIFSRTFKIGTSNYSYSFTGNRQHGVFFGRRVASFSRIIIVTMINDTMASAEVNFILKGNLIIIRPEWSTSKPFSHSVKRYITFVKRTNPVTKERWHRVSFTAAYGISDSAEMAIDSIRIVTPYDTIVSGNPFEISISQSNPITLRRGDYIWIDVKAHSNLGASDKLAGFVINGKNRYKNVFRERKLMYYIHPQHYVRLIQIRQNQLNGFNQLILDFYALATLNQIDTKYRSMLVAIPYRIIE